jgi:predicted Zn-dependent peptidase
VTNFFCVLPAENFELGLFLEADRMQNLKLDEKLLAVEQQIVSEEFKETCLSEPYGDVWHLMSGLAYEHHPYRWPVIGLSMDHISSARINDVRHFYESFYGPDNAICVVAGPVKAEVALEKVRAHFGSIKNRSRPKPGFALEQMRYLWPFIPEAEWSRDFMKPISWQIFSQVVMLRACTMHL